MKFKMCNGESVKTGGKKIRSSLSILQKLPFHVAKAVLLQCKSGPFTTPKGSFHVAKAARSHAKNCLFDKPKLVYCNIITVHCACNRVAVGPFVG